jgi:hypothetical protein
MICVERSVDGTGECKMLREGFCIHLLTVIRSLLISGVFHVGLIILETILEKALTKV